MSRRPATRRQDISPRIVTALKFVLSTATQIAKRVQLLARERARHAAGAPRAQWLGRSRDLPEREAVMETDANPNPIRAFGLTKFLPVTVPILAHRSSQKRVSYPKVVPSAAL
jgi:hypothetical protein